MRAQDVADLRAAEAAGKTVAVSTLRALDSCGTMALVDKSGGDPASLKFIEMRPATMLAALQQGRADIAAMITPALGEAQESGSVRTFGDPYGGIAPRLMIAGWFSNADYVQRNPSIVERFTKVMHEANVYANGHHAETAPLFADYAKIDAAVIAKMTRLTNVTSLDPSLIQPAIDAAAKYKFIDAAFPAKSLLA